VIRLCCMRRRGAVSLTEGGGSSFNESFPAAIVRIYFTVKLTLVLCVRVVPIKVPVNVRVKVP
jgi:hypothetical protein